jgi:deoxyribodipyrimidine photo-lyase
MREVAQAAWARLNELRSIKDKTDSQKRFAASVDSFIGRLHWRDHFTQKLEDEPRFEFEDMHPGYRGLREDDPDHPHLRAWAEGRTGLPFVDACMRCLQETGWMNFRMRAMLMATCSYHLWRHWRSSSLVLARLFTDYEPGVHYPQSQMQSGVTGINTVRVYNPVKQGHDQDPDGLFVARFVPELAGLPGKLRQEPWKASPMELKDAGLRLGEDYPERIVDHEEAAREAKRKIYARRRDPDFKAIADEIQAKHGSRKSGLRQTGRGRRRSTRGANPAPPKAQQGDFWSSDA